MGNIIGTIIFGAVIGVLARLFKKDSNISMLWTVILGTAGVLVGNGILALFNYGDATGNTGGIDWMRWIICTILAMVFIGIYMGVTGRKEINK
ncbi:MAG: GlsB/YeaQ/YmgE family stress response membrane protein [Trueperella sp.]|nr:GlsB/YeaQ/YmgE family stress response membrane protein [Trueperella sp.]